MPKLYTLQNLQENLYDMGDGTVARQTVEAHAQFTLLSNYAAQGSGSATVPMPGGDYIWRAIATNWNGATATLEFLDLDGTTWTPVKDSSNANVTLTANGQKAIGVAQGGVLRVTVSAAAPTGMYSQVAGL